ncbi:WxPxxD family membrane protein [Fictibacillus sp. UD]|uniref:WxPxxD family membrane protein n=1 Tax=Fictibacillus sp. UD TaxID=3038777 RepID=UPI0037457D51
MGKRSIVSLAILFLFIVLWFINNSRYMGFSTLESLIYMNNSAFGYNSFKAYALFYTIPFLFFLNFFLPTEKPYTLVRISRERHYFKFVGKVFLTALLFTIGHMLINNLLTFLFMDVELLKEVRYFFISFVQMIGLVFYFFWIGILYRIFYDLSNSFGLAIFVTYLLVGVIYSLGLLIVPADIWDPFKDLDIFQSLLENKKTLTDVFLSYIRLFALGVTFYLVGSPLFLKKDIL